MSKFKHLSRPMFDRVEFFPLILDYDLELGKPRGGSAYLDFFSFGKLSSLIDESFGTGMILVKKSSFPVKDGFFLVDFSKILKSPSVFINNIKDLNFKSIYVEDSGKYSLNQALEKIAEDVEVTLINFRV